MFWVKMVRFQNTFVIFTTSKKNSQEIKDVLVQNFGLNKYFMPAVDERTETEDDGEGD